MKKDKTVVFPGLICPICYHLADNVTCFEGKEPGDGKEAINYCVCIKCAGRLRLIKEGNKSSYVIPSREELRSLPKSARRKLDVFVQAVLVVKAGNKN